MTVSTMRGWMAGIVAALGACTTASPGQPPKEHAKARLISEFARVTPGSTAWFGLDYEIEAGWHLYWDGVNDSGFATKLNAKATPDYKIGGIVWPAPRRLVSPGDILDHIYEKHVTLLFPVEVPQNAKPGQELSIHAAPEWLVCHDVCLPGSADLTLKVMVAEPGEKPAHSPQAAQFATARQRVPKPLPKENGPMDISVSKERVTLTIKGMSEIAFYPKPECVTLPSLVKEGQSKGDHLTLTFEAQPGKKPVLTGIVEAKPSDSGLPMLWSLEFDLSGVNKPAPEPSDKKAPVRGD